ncbi:type I restriction endonuclease subunit R [Endozoicomonas lisbonensis]|uniref:type I restriction endonuclease subunit R n=1 Tax=Endozoicomonas lisbonensis TaxID=3120522 RepID=UPI0033970F41
MWEEILQPDNFLLILGRYLHLEVKDKELADGRIVKKETMIFPRYHQWSAVSTLLNGVRKEGTGARYLIQHSAGSGKSNSIAWLCHQLASLHYPEGEQAGNKVFDSVIVITDRTVLDSQLQDTIYQFEHNRGMIARINREEAQGSKSSQLAQELLNATSIIIVTIQTFPHVLKAIQENEGLAKRSFAIIADEAHSSQTGSTARQMREVLMAEHLSDSDEITGEDILDATLASRRGSDKISYFAFTATPKAKTLELFGRKPNAKEDSKPEPYHVYTMRQAIEEGYILDVLKNYTSYSVAYKLAHTDENQDSEVDSKRAKSELVKWARLHPHNIAQKVEVIIEHFRTRVKHLLNGEAKAMVVTSSRKEAVRYKLAFDKYVQEKGYGRLQAMVAFSGEVDDKESGPEPFTERNLNPNLNGRDMRKAFDTDEYQVMLVANKFQTGFDQPKLVAMYVDKKLTGVDCIQTLSRLNRTCPGKDTTFVLDFVNDPQDVLEEFKTYYQVAELAGESEPNLVYDLQHKLGEQGIYQWHEVTQFADAYFDPKRGQDALSNYIKPPADRFAKRYREALDVLKDAQERLREAISEGEEGYRQKCERGVQAAKEAKDSLDTFKKDLGSYIRFYEFISQIVPFDDHELEQLNVFGKHLLPLLKQERLDEDIDLELVEMTHYKLKEKRTQHLKLQGDGGNLLNPVTSIGSHAPKDKKSELLSDILEQMNDLFAGEDLSDGDRVIWLNKVVAKVSENDRAVDQVAHNSQEQAMLGDFPDAVQSAVIESMDVQNRMDMDFLSNPDVSRQVVSLVYQMMKAMGQGQIGKL